MKPVVGICVLAIILMVALPAQAITVIPTTDPAILAGTILGPGVELVGPATLTGASGQSGTFSDGGTSVGLASGVVLSSGDVSQIPGASNTTNGTGNESIGSAGTANQVSTVFGGAGDPRLSILAGQPTFDAVSLKFTFQFTGGVGGNIGVNYVFASEEYLNWVGSYNDVFAFYLDGVNIALTPTSDGVSVNTINPNTNSAYYINNVPGAYPSAGLPFQFDGLTTILNGSKIGLAAGTHTMEFILADAGDGNLDAGVFIQAGSFSPETAIPEPGTMMLLGSGLVGLAGWGRKKFRK